MNTAVGAHCVEQPVHGDLQAGCIAVGQQMLKERMPGLIEQRLQRIGVGGVTGLGALGLRHLQLVEQHDLQLFGRAEVDLLADHPVCRFGGVADLVGELALEFGKLFQVDRDAGGLHFGQRALYWQLHVAQQRRRVDAGQLLVERVGEVHHRARPKDHCLDGLVVDAPFDQLSSSSESCCCSGLSARSSRFRYRSDRSSSAKLRCPGRTR